MSSIRQGVLIISYIYISPTGPFVQKVDYAIHRIAYWFPQLVDPLDSDLSIGQCYPMFEQLEPEGQMYAERPSLSGLLDKNGPVFCFIFYLS